MKENVYMHAISNYDVNKQIISLIDIARDGQVVSLRKRGRTESFSFSGLDYVSLCDYEKRFNTPYFDNHYNAYYTFVKNGISLAFNKENIDAITPEYFEARGNSLENMLTMNKLGNGEKRYSDLMDEVQVKDSVSLDELQYLTFPTKTFFMSELAYTKKAKYDLLQKKLYEIRLILDYFNYDRDIYDIDTQIKLDDEGVKRILSKK